MPYTNPKDCGDAVLAARLAMTGVDRLLVIAGLAVGMLVLGAGLLRLRRST
jgi:hypothetical protein